MATIAHQIDEKERTRDVKICRKFTFGQMPLSENVRKSLSESGFLWPTSVQANAIPLGKAGNDLLLQSKSGTGKTLTFCTILLEMFEPSIKQTQAIIIAPTREIAIQIEAVLLQLSKHCPAFKVQCVIGGLEVMNDRKKIQGASAIVGTPGRVWHLIRCQMLNVSKVRLLIIDEADKIMSEAFESDFNQIYNSLPGKKQIIACSATLAEEYDEKITALMVRPVLVSTSRKATFLLGIKQFVYEIEEQSSNLLEMNAKVEALKRIFSAISYNQCLLFSSSQSRTETYSNLLRKEDWPCDFINGGKPQAERLKIFKKFRNYQTRILIATDLMSRGIDSENVNLIINLEVPEDAPTYLHRIGRAGRFGSHGVAITFICSQKDKETFTKVIDSIESTMKIFKIPKDGEIPNFLHNWAMENELEVFNSGDESDQKIKNKQGNESVHFDEISSLKESNSDKENNNRSSKAFKKNRRRADCDQSASSTESEANGNQHGKKHHFKKFSVLDIVTRQMNGPKSFIRDDEDLFEDYKKVQSKQFNEVQTKQSEDRNSQSHKEDSDEEINKNIFNKLVDNTKKEEAPLGAPLDDEDIFDDYTKAQSKSEDPNHEGPDLTKLTEGKEEIRNNFLRSLQNVVSGTKAQTKSEDPNHDGPGLTKLTEVTEEIRNNFLRSLQNVVSGIAVINQEIEPKAVKKKSKPENIYGIDDSLESTTDSDEYCKKQEKVLKPTIRTVQGRCRKPPDVVPNNSPSVRDEAEDKKESDSTPEAQNESDLECDSESEDAADATHCSYTIDEPTQSADKSSSVPAFNVYENPIAGTSRNESVARRLRNHRDVERPHSAHNRDDGDASSYRTVSSNKSSGFDEKTSSKKSSGIATSSEYFSTSEEDYDTSTSYTDSDEEFSEYESNESESETDYETEVENEAQPTQELDYNERYQLAYNRWTTTYWNQVTQIRDYAKFAKFVRSSRT